MRTLFSDLTCRSAHDSLSLSQTDRLTHRDTHTWDQHGGNDLGVLQHVNDAALEVFAAVGLQVAVGKREKGREMRAESASGSMVSMSEQYACTQIQVKHLDVLVIKFILWEKGGLDELRGTSLTHSHCTDLSAARLTLNFAFLRF